MKNENLFTLPHLVEHHEEKLGAKIAEHFPGVTIYKQRLKDSRLKERGLPAYVAEWVLDTIVPGNGLLTAEETKKLHEWADRVVPQPSEANRWRNRLLIGESIKILASMQVQVDLSSKKARRAAFIPMLGKEEAAISDDIVEQNPALLNEGMWGVIELIFVKETGVVVIGFKPMQARTDLTAWKNAREAFTIKEWQAMLITSMGYAPENCSIPEQRYMLARLLPLVQKSAHIVELAPKGTGKSYIYENISPRIWLVSGGNISPAVLFMNNRTQQPGILARYAAVVLDEVQTLKFSEEGEIIGGLKGFLANGYISRGGLHRMASDSGFVMLANITLDDQQRPLHHDLFSELPKFMQETAFLDRIKGVIPGWKISKLQPSSFAKGIALKADYFGDILLKLREDIAMDAEAASRSQLDGKVYTRNAQSVEALAAGYYKLLFPHGKATDDEFRTYCLEPAIELRQEVWTQLQSKDDEFRQYPKRISAA